MEVQHALDEQNTITATSEGILHLNEEVKAKNYISKGVTLAQIYPEILLGEFVNIVAYVDSQDIMSIHKNDKVHFRTKKDYVEILELSCRVTEIGASPEKTENGNYFKITAQTIVSKENQEFFRYGLRGDFTIIVGEKTYFDYYKDNFF